jgi:hypothetical protein
MSLRLDWATHEAAKFACENWHYSKTMPCNKLVKIGVLENAKFIGVVLFSPGATPTLCKTYKLTQQECCELTRVALKEHSTPVSKIMAIALKMLKKSNPGLKLVISFADTKEGHHGGIYQATNWVYVGTAVPRLIPMLKGKHVHERSVSAMVKAGKIKRSDFLWIPAKPKYKYLMPLNNDMLSKVIHLKKPYPKRVGSKDNVASGFQSEEGGATPNPTLQP